MRIKQRFHKLFTFDYSGSKKVKVPVFVPFDADEMLIRSVSFGLSIGIHRPIQYLYVDRLDAVLDTFTDGASHCPNTTFIIDKAINGEWTFELKENNGVDSTAANGFLVMLVEFVSYDSK